jgi:membrane AbrB-like protein
MAAKAILSVAKTAAGYAAAAGAGALAAWAGIPLAWVLGPLVLAASLGISAVEIKAPTALRRFGQLIIGGTVGLAMTREVLQSLLPWFPAMIVTAAVAILVSAAVSVGFARAARLDEKTAFFALMPGGLAEMGNIGASVGARTEPIAITQALRVGLVVLLIPTTLVAFGIHAPVHPIARMDLPYPMTALLLAAGCVGAMLASFLRFNNPWMIGSLLASASLTALGFLDGQMPHWIFALGQILIGYNIGSRFRRSVLRHLPRVTLVAMATILLLIGLMASYAAGFAAGFSLDFATAMLVSSPGGTSEMAATAQVLNLSVALVTAFHVTRAILVNAFATYYWHALSHLGFFRALQGWLSRII